MEITKHFLNEVLENTMETYSKKIMSLPNIKLKYIEKEEFLSSAKEDYLIQLQIQMGLYEKFEKEYPNFLVVYNVDKNPLMYLTQNAYFITVCYEIAKDKLKSFKKEEVREYLKYQFAHEITHIIEKDFVNKNKSQWEEILRQNNGVESLAYEELAEITASKIANEKDFKKITDNLWGSILKKAEKLQRI